MATATRLRRLEEATAGMGGAHCSLCADWPHFKSNWPDGRSSDPHPETCPRCGWTRQEISVQYDHTPSKGRNADA